jgi:hypothetical protein
MEIFDLLADYYLKMKYYNSAIKTYKNDQAELAET